MNFDQIIASVIAQTARLISGIQAQLTCHDLLRTQAIYYANHGSHLDAMVIWALLPVEVRHKLRFVASRQYWQRSPFRRYLSCRVFNMALVDRNNEAGPAGARQSLTTMYQALDDGSSLLIFPEGTRGTSTEIAPFKIGLYHLARHNPAIPLVPIYLENLNRILPKGEFLPIPFLSRAVFGESLYLMENESKPEFLQRAYHTLVQLKESHH